jgi:uncharacterized ferredoxin-like protein
MKSRLILLFTILNLSLFSLVTPFASAQGFNAYSGVGCGGGGDASGSAICNGQSKGNPISGPNGLLHKITLFIALIAGAAAIILLIVGAIRFITSGGDSNAVSSAKGTIVNALIGLAIIVFSASIITFVVDRI